MNSELKSKADQICSNYPVKRAGILPVMRLIQDSYGCISEEAELELADYFQIPPSDVRELVTFYTLFYSKPKGKCYIQIFRTLSCALRGAEDLIRHLEEKLGIKCGETTADGEFSLDHVECLGACEIAPSVQIGKEYAGTLTKGKLDEFIEAVKREA
jgi:NADH-quinone oxidoreductase subunit E